MTRYCDGDVGPAAKQQPALVFLHRRNMDMYIRENLLKHEVVDTLTCSVSPEGKMSETLLVFLQISLSLKLSITSWSLSRFSECSYVYYVYCCTYCM